jgi:hypothetical protein
MRRNGEVGPPPWEVGGRGDQTCENPRWGAMVLIMGKQEAVNYLLQDSTTLRQCAMKRDGDRLISIAYNLADLAPPKCRQKKNGASSARQTHNATLPVEIVPRTSASYEVQREVLMTMSSSGDCGKNVGSGELARDVLTLFPTLTDFIGRREPPLR